MLGQIYHISIPELCLGPYKSLLLLSLFIIILRLLLLLIIIIIIISSSSSGNGFEDGAGLPIDSYY